MALDVFGEPVNPPVDPLVSAASKGDLKAMGTLLGQGVDVNALGGTHGNALTEAASRGRLGAIKFLLDRGADVNAVGGDLRTALEAAARNKNLDALKLLIRSGADLNATGGAALGVAASCKNLDAVKLLVAQGTNVNTAGGLVLQNAVKLGELDIIELLLEKGADPNAQWHGHPTPLVLAASSGKLDVIKLLLDKGADLNARWNDPAFGDMGTPLVAAAINGKLDVIELLLDKGADLNVQRVDCRNALSSAAGAGRLDAVELLLARGAHVNGLDDDYITSLTAVDGNELHYAFETPLLCSIRGEHMPIASLLIDRGANVRDPRCHLVAAAAEAPHSSSSFIKLLVDAGVSVKDRCEGALQISSKRGILDDLQLLLGLGADVNEQGGLFGNPLQAAAYCSRGDLDVVELLLREGANVNAKGGRYGSVLQAAVCATHENLDLIQMILDQGADVNMQGGFCGSSLQAAASLGRNKIVKLLLRRGANVNLCVGDKQGASLLHTAVACQDIRTLDLLLEAGAHTYISHTDTLGQTPLYIAIDHPECFQSLKASLDLALNSEEGNKWKNLLSSAIDKADFDGCAPLHRAVENNFLDAAEWLIDHDANVHIPDFNGVTAFQRASHLRRIDLMSKIFPHVMKLGKVEISIKATDWRAAQSSRWKNYIMLALNGSKLPSVQVFDGVELVKFFHAISYPLDYRSTSDVPTQDDKCIANASFQRALV